MTPKPGSSKGPVTTFLALLQSDMVRATAGSGVVDLGERTTTKLSVLPGLQIF